MRSLALNLLPGDFAIAVITIRFMPALVDIVTDGMEPIQVQGAIHLLEIPFKLHEFWPQNAPQNGLKSSAHSGDLCAQFGVVLLASSA